MKLTFFSAPHRVMLAAGSLQLVGAMLLWGNVMLGRVIPGWEVAPWPWPPAWVHAGLMLFGVFPFFIFGFLMTALPKWAGMLSLPHRVYLPTFLLPAGGWLLFYTALAGAAPDWGLVGLLLVAAGWCCGVAQLWWRVLPGEGGSLHARLLVGATGLGAVGLLSYAWGLFRLDWQWLRVAEALAMWGVLVPIFFGVMHRMLPFFSASAVPGYGHAPARWSLLSMLAVCAGHAIATGVGRPAWAAPSDLAGAALAFYLSWQWWDIRIRRVPMLLMLHVGSAWLGVALLLYGVQECALWLEVNWGGLVPLHVLTIGYFTSLVIAMGTRVTRGHSGRVIAEDRVGGLCFWLLQGVLLVRISGEFLPTANGIAAVCWVAVFVFWAWEHLPMYFLPRPDGRPG